jgi:hypothetical protein
MWVGTTKWQSLLRDPRWTVELHADNDHAALGEAHYPLVRLADIASVRGEKLTPRDWPDFLFCYLGLEHIESQSGALVGFSPTPGHAIRSQSRVFRPGDVLYGRLRPYLNKVYAATPGAVHTGVCSAELLVLVPHPERVRTLFLRELLASEWVQARVQRMQFGSALPRLQQRDLLALRVPLPPLEVQHTIEARLRPLRERRASLLAEAQRLPEQTREALERCLRDGRELQLVDRPEAEALPHPNRLPADYAPRKRRQRPVGGV